MGAIRTMLVEDEKDINFIIQMALELSSIFDVTCFRSAEDALDTLTSDCAKFDLLVVDNHLPRMSGLEFIAKLKTITACAKIPSIVVSAAVTKADAEACEYAGVLGLITKPFDPIALPQQVLDIYRSGRGFVRI